jgi:hypothetical protein
MGRIMREYATLPPGAAEDLPQVREWLGNAFAYVRSLPAKRREMRSNKAQRRSTRAA